MDNLSDQPKPPRRVAIGTHVVLELLTTSGETERLEFDLVIDRYADFVNGFLGESTPLAKAIAGQTAGSLVPYTMGDVRAAHVIAVTPSRGANPTDAEARREANLRKAVRQSDLTNAILFASSFSGKWGDYDPTGLDKELEDDED